MMKSFLLIAMVAVAAVGVVCLTPGCGGGGGGDSWPMEGAAELTSSDVQLGRGPADFVFITARRSGYISVAMNPADGDGSLGDPYLVVRRCASRDAWNGATTVAEDDDSGPGLAAYVCFWASEGTTYAIGLTTYQYQTGRYYYRVEELSTAAVRSSAGDPGDKPTDASLQAASNLR